MDRPRTSVHGNAYETPGPRGAGRGKPELDIRDRSAYSGAPRIPEIVDDAVLLLAPDDRCLACNDAAVALLGFADRVAVLRTPPSQLWPAAQPDGADSRLRNAEFLRIARTRGSHRHPWTFRRADGDTVDCEVCLTPLETDHGPLVHAVLRDLGPLRRQARKQRRDARREGLRRLAGGLAHGFNNLLLVIEGRAELLRDRVGDAAGPAADLDEIRTAAARARTLVDELVAFSGKRPVHREAVELDAVVRGALPLLRALLHRTLTLEFEPAPRPLPVLADAERLREVLLQLAANARDAAREGGRMRLETRRLPRAALIRRLQEHFEGPHVAVLTVMDDGRGMTGAVRDRAFDPFFTIRAPGAGTGMGLAKVLATVEQHDGRVVLESEPDRGTRLDLVLPIRDPEPERALPERRGVRR